MSYSYRPSRFGGRESGRDWRENDWRLPADDPRLPAAENAISWLLDRGIFETVGLAPDGELLMRLSERAVAESERPAQNDTAPAPSPSRSRPRQRRRSASAQKEPPADTD